MQIMETFKMGKIEAGTWEEVTDACYRISYYEGEGRISILRIVKTADDSAWDDNNDFTYLSSIRFEHKSDAVWYLTSKLNLIDDISLRTAAQEFLNNEPLDYTNILDYLE